MRRITIAAALVGLLFSGCSLHQGRPFTQDPHTLYEAGVNLEARGDRVGANTLYVRLQERFPGSTWALLAALRQRAWPAGAIQRDHAATNAPTR